MFSESRSRQVIVQPARGRRAARELQDDAAATTERQNEVTSILSLRFIST